MTSLNDTIREVFLAHGFTIKAGQTDLKPYVYEAVHALLSKLRAPVADERAVPLSQYDYQALFDAIGKAVKVHPNLAIEISVQAFRAALASAPVAGEAVTDRMIQAGAKAAREYFERTGGNDPAVIYRAMRAVADAAPQASEAVRDVGNVAGQLWDDAIACDWPAFREKVAAALSAQPGAQRTGGGE